MFEQSPLGLLARHPSSITTIVTGLTATAIQIFNKRNLSQKSTNSPRIVHLAKEADERRKRVDRLIQATTKTDTKVNG